MTAKTNDRLMTLAELSTYLHMGRNTALKLIEDETIPALQVDGEWRFRRADIESWLQEQLESEYDDFEDVVDGAHVPLGDLMPQEAIIHDMRAKTSLSAIEELAIRAYNEKWLNDKPWFIGSLVERETLASTAMEGGVAFLHTRSRDTSKMKRPFVICGRSYDGIDFGAPDGKPTFIFFLLGLKYDKLHLPILGRLARLTMRNPTIVSRLRATTSPIKMRATLLKLDAEELSATHIPQVAQRAPAQRRVFDPKERLRQIMKINAKRLYEAKKEEERQAKEAKKEAAKKRREKLRKEKAEAAKLARAAAKKVVAKKAPAKKATTKKEAAAKTTTAKKAPAKKATTKKAATTKTTTAKKATAKKPATKKAPAKKPAAKKPAAKKPAAKKATTTAKKAAAKKPAAKKKPAKKS